MPTTMTCGRRSETSKPATDDPGPDSWGAGNTCSYCGSMHPDDVLKAIREGARMTPTDKGYKLYVGDRSAKAYFHHFTTMHRVEFIQLYNDKKINLEASGYFYVLPYFCRPITAESKTEQE